MDVEAVRLQGPGRALEGGLVGGFTVVKREIPGLSQRMLTVTLRNLERDGLVTRTVHPVVPPRVDYELTPLGHTLRSAVCGLLDWSMTNVDAIDRAREAYDARQADM